MESNQKTNTPKSLGEAIKEGLAEKKLLEREGCIPTYEYPDPLGVKAHKGREPQARDNKKTQKINTWHDYCFENTDNWGTPVTNKNKSTPQTIHNCTYHKDCVESPTWFSTANRNGVTFGQKYAIGQYMHVDTVQGRRRSDEPESEYQSTYSGRYPAPSAKEKSRVKEIFNRVNELHPCHIHHTPGPGSHSPENCLFAVRPENLKSYYEKHIYKTYRTNHGPSLRVTCPAYSPVRDEQCRKLANDDRIVRN